MPGGLRHLRMGCERWNDGDGEEIPFEVIVWMPLPKPYKEKTE